jgi:hypothetical protein
LEIVLAAMALNQPGGMQTYTLTVAPHLERLGHEVTLFSDQLGPVADLAAERGLRVCGREDELPPTCDAVLSNDAPSALTMADRYPRAVRGIVVHSGDLDVHMPPAHDSVVSFAVAMNDVVERRLKATANPPAIVRLTQPIDMAHLYPAAPIAESPRYVLLLGNMLVDPVRQTLMNACEHAGLAWRQVGMAGDLLLDPYGQILEADIVVGQGRSALDGMSCGRAVWVFGPGAGDGWVTEASYPALEADGFRGRATDDVIMARDFGRALEGYDRSMGQVNRQLVLMHHSPYDHAVALAEQLQAERPAAPPPAPLREMARLVRTQHDSQARVWGVADELRKFATENERLAKQSQRLLEDSEWHRRRWEEIVSTRRWKMTQLAAWPLDQVRRVARRT